ncbi:MAG: hypothetical protein COB41_00505 [Proteobacteria bacterium]|nr:MAG: hypothetical protein COB41_00505 [Pseudomonadota bacterium]
MQLEKKSHFFEGIVEGLVEDIEIADETCPECNKGVLQVLDLHHVVIVTCDQCDYKEKQK